MPIYYGEGPREIYWQDREGKWHHPFGHGKSFDSMKEAQDDYNGQSHIGWIETPIGYICMVILFFLVIFFRFL